jgi:hypothetical protein
MSETELVQKAVVFASTEAGLEWKEKSLEAVRKDIARAEAGVMTFNIKGKDTLGRKITQKVITDIAREIKGDEILEAIETAVRGHDDKTERILLAKKWANKVKPTAKQNLLNEMRK